MKLPRYSIEQDNNGQRSIWVIKLGRTILSHHEFKSDAERTVQRYIAEDRDFAMEGR